MLLYVVDCFYRYGYPDYTYLSRVRSELAAKGIGSTSTSSAAVTSAVPPKTTTASSALFTPVDIRTSTHRSSTSLAGSHERDAASVAAAAQPYNSSSYDFDERLAPHVGTATSVSAVSSLDTTSWRGIVTLPYSHHQPCSLPAPSSSSDAPSASGFSGARPSHAVSTVDRMYHGGAAGSADSSSRLSSTGGHVTHTSRRDDYNRLHESRVHHSSSNAAFLHSTTSRTGAYDTVRRYR